MHDCVQCFSIDSIQVFETAIESNSTYMTDFCDGQFFKDHLLFGSDKQALQIILYWDDVEVANPLGSYRGVHKLSLCDTIAWYNY